MYAQSAPNCSRDVSIMAVYNNLIWYNTPCSYYAVCKLVTYVLVIYVCGLFD